MKTSLVLGLVMLLCVNNLKSMQDSTKSDDIQVCEIVDLDQIAAILGWNASNVKSEPLSSSNAKSGVCRYTYNDEELIVRATDDAKPSDVNTLFTTVGGSFDKETGEQIFEMNKIIKKLKVSLYFKTKRVVNEAYELMENITDLVNKNHSSSSGTVKSYYFHRNKD